MPPATRARRRAPRLEKEDMFLAFIGGEHLLHHPRRAILLLASSCGEGYPSSCEEACYLGHRESCVLLPGHGDRTEPRGGAFSVVGENSRDDDSYRYYPRRTDQRWVPRIWVAR